MKTAVVMAGGRGTRLWPLTRHLPKAMVPIDKRPILEFVVAGLRSAGVERIVAVLQYHPSAILSHFGDGSRFGVSMDYVLQEGELGTAGSVRQALELIDDEEVIVSSSDILFHGDLLPGRELHERRRSIATVVLSQVEDPSAFGEVVLGPDGPIREFREKPRRAPARRALVSTGLYFLHRRALADVPAGTACDFGLDLFPALVRRGRAVHGWELAGYWRDVGTPAALCAAREDVQEDPGLLSLMTRWPARRRGSGGRLFIHAGPSA